jgi:Domain of unknown function (DUF4351)
MFSPRSDMPYISSFERNGIRKAYIGTVLRQLNKKLGVRPIASGASEAIDLQEQIQQLSIAQLETLFDDLLDFNNTNDLMAWLSAHG